MDTASLRDTLLYDMQGIVSHLLSPQAEVELETISMPSPSLRTMTSPIAQTKVENLYPSLFRDLKSQPGPISTLPYAFELDTSILGRRTQGSSNTGLVIALPKAYAEQMALISNQKPILSMACSIDYRFQEVYLCWQSDQDSAPATHDLWLPIAGSQIIDEAWLNNAYGDHTDCVDEERYCWTDVLVICGERIVAGGFWSSTTDSLKIQIQSSQAINFKPHQYWPDEEVVKAAERAAYLGSVAPWHEEVCINESGRRYCRLLESHTRPSFRS